MVNISNRQKTPCRKPPINCRYRR